MSLISKSPLPTPLILNFLFLFDCGYRYSYLLNILQSQAGLPEWSKGVDLRPIALSARGFKPHRLQDIFSPREFNSVDKNNE